VNWYAGDHHHPGRVTGLQENLASDDQNKQKGRYQEEAADEESQYQVSKRVHASVLNRVGGMRDVLDVAPKD